jgi:hypothetical protein
MAILAFSGFELGESSLNDDLLAFNSNASFVTTTPKTGSYCGRINLTSGKNSRFSLRTYDAVGVSSINFTVSYSYLQFYFKYATKPSGATPNEIFAITDSTDGVKIAIRINSDGKLCLYDSGGSIIGSAGSTALSSSTWYKINFKIDTGASAAYELKIDDNTELSGTGSFTNTAKNFNFGVSSMNATENVDFFYDDIILSDSSYPNGNAAVKIIKPKANGSTMSWSDGTGSSDYTQVNELPVSSSEYIQSPTSGNPNIALFDMESCSTVGITGSILGVKLLVRTRENTTVTSSTFLRIKSDDTNSDNTAFNGFTTEQNKCKLLTTDPKTSSDWTISSIDSMEMGVVENNAVAVRCVSVLGTVAYIPSTTSIKSVNGLAKASIKNKNGLATTSIKNFNGLA